MRTVFVHGAGRSGDLAWPMQAQTQRAEWVYLPRDDERDDPSSDAARVLDLLGGDHGVVVAASYGALAGLIAAATAPVAVRALVLFEPACFSAARGSPAVEQHIAAMAPVFAVADDPDVTDVEFSRRFAIAMGLEGQPLPPDQVAATVPRLRRMPPPWTVEVDADVVSEIPTLVVTGGWSPVYEEVASALGHGGARHAILTGHGHRPQDHTDANALIEGAATAR